MKVIHAEVQTGIVVDPEGNRLLGADALGIEFDSEEDARVYAQCRIKVRPDIECAIQSASGDTIDVLRNEGYIDKQLSLSRQKKSFFRKFF